MMHRIKVTSSCRDCDGLERHPNAGMIETNEDGVKYQYMHNGIKIIWGTYHSPWMNEIIKNLKGHHEPQEELCFYYMLKTLNKESNMIELGCNWSYYTIWFNKEVEKPFNIAMEPVNKLLNGGIKNSILNECKNITFKQGYIGNRFEEKSKFKDWHGNLLEIPMYTLEKIIKDSDKEYFDVIHSDIQGGEIALLSSIENITEKIGYFIISTHSIDIHNKCCRYLDKYNFEIIQEHNLQESYSEDGLIFAINRNNIFRYENNVKDDLIRYLKNNCKISKKPKSL